MDHRRAVLVIAALAAVGAAAAGGVWFAALRGPGEPDVRAWLAEYDSLQRSLSGLGERAFQDSAVKRQRGELDDAIAGRMRAFAPGTDSLLERMQALEAAMDRVRAGGELDPRRYAELLHEYEAVRAALEPAERAAFQDPQIQARFERFRDLLHSTMLERATSDERAALERMRELEARLEEIPPEIFDSLTSLSEEDPTPSLDTPDASLHVSRQRGGAGARAGRLRISALTDAGI